MIPSRPILLTKCREEIHERLENSEMPLCRNPATKEEGYVFAYLFESNKPYVVQRFLNKSERTFTISYWKDAIPIHTG